MVRKTLHLHDYFGEAINVKFSVYPRCMDVHVYDEYGTQIFLEHYLWDSAVANVNELMAIRLMREIFGMMLATTQDDISKQRVENYSIMADRCVRQVLNELDLI